MKQIDKIREARFLRRIVARGDGDIDFIDVARLAIVAQVLRAARSFKYG